MIAIKLDDTQKLTMMYQEYHLVSIKKREVSTYAAYQYNGLCNQDCLLFGNKKHRVTTAKLASELKIPESYIPKITKQLKKRRLFQLLKVSVEDMPLPKIQKRFLYLMSYHVWNQQWQSVAVLKRMDFAPETIRIAVKYIKSYWTYRTLTITD